MPESFENLPLTEIWTTFLHISGIQLTTDSQAVYDGRGTKSGLAVSTTGVSAENLQVGQITFPTTESTTNNIPVLITPTTIGFKTIVDVLSTAAPLINGTFSSPVITVSNGVVTKVTGTGGATKMFMLPNRVTTGTSPTIADIIGAIQWLNPYLNDKAFVMQKVTGTATLADLRIYELTYTGLNQWSLTNSY